MSVIHFVGGEKGGVGKSVVARLLSQYFIDAGIDHIGLDADQSHPTLTRFYRDYTYSVDLKDYRSADQIMELAVARDYQIVVDLPAQSQRFLDRWIEDNALLELSHELSVPIRYWFVVDDGHDSSELLNGFLDAYGPSIATVIVMNEGRGADFSEIDTLPALRALTEPARPQRMLLPALDPGTMRRIDRGSFSFWAAANVATGADSRLSLMERQRTRIWLKKAYAPLKAILDA